MSETIEEYVKRTNPLMVDKRRKCDCGTLFQWVSYITVVRPQDMVLTQCPDCKTIKILPVDEVLDLRKCLKSEKTVKQ